MGWQVKLLEHLSDLQIASLIGLDRSDDFNDAETEAPDLILQLTISGEPIAADINRLIEATSQAEWKGQANTLSKDNRIRWQAIEQVSASCEKPETEAMEWQTPKYPPISNCETDFDASSIIRHRRSAQAFDTTAVLPLTQFYRMLDSLLPRQNTTPFDALPWQPRIHLVLFVHRVEGLKPGLYVFPRSDSGKLLLEQNMRDSFDWTRPAICPSTLPLYHLVSANCQNAARTVSCHQDIASNSAFSLSMLAEYEDNISERPWSYRQLYWEAGMVGQSLYLEAEAVAMRATGIGCYFDDAVHEILGIQNKKLQVIYHFTVGLPLLDKRLISLPPYGHL